MRCVIKTCEHNIIDIVVTANVDELSSARICRLKDRTPQTPQPGLHKLWVTLSASVSINYHLSHQSVLPYLYC